MTDPIERADAIKVIEETPFIRRPILPHYIKAKINKIPSAEPQQGEWIRKTKQCQGYLYTCSECGQVIYSETDHDLKEFHAYCGRCGARMKGVDDERF